MFMIVLTSCSISPRIPWVAGNNLTSSMLLYFFESNASLCGVSYKYQPTSARSNMPTYTLKHPGVSCGSPLLSPGHRVLLGGTWHGKLFVGQEKYASVPWKSQMKDCSSICQKVFVYFLLKVIGIGSVWVLLLGNRQPLNFCFGALKLVLSTSALSMATIDAFEGRKASI